MIPALKNSVNEQILKRNWYLVSSKEDKSSFTICIESNLTRYDIVYLKKGSIFHTPSTLYARIYPYKTNEYYFLTHELVSDCNPQIYTYINSADDMKISVNSLFDALEKLAPITNELAISREKFDIAIQNKNKEIMRVCQTDNLDFFDMRFYEEYILLPRFIGQESPYIFIINGKRKKALKLYKKYEQKNILTLFEKRLLENIDDISNAQIMTASYFSTNLAEGKLFLSSVLLSFPIFSVLFFTLHFILKLILANGAVFWAGPPLYTCLIPAGLSAVFGGLGFRRLFIPIIYRKNKDNALVSDKLFNSKGTNILAYSAFSVALIFSLFSSVMMNMETVAFYDESLKMPFKEEIRYESIEKICKIEGRYNDFNDYIPYGSYVIYFTNNEPLDLYGYTSIEETEKYILPILLPHSGEVEIYKSDIDLP